MCLQQSWTHCEWSINTDSVLCSRASRTCKGPFLGHSHPLTDWKEDAPTPSHFWLRHGYTKLLKTLSSAVSSKLLISEAQKKSLLKKMPAEDPGPWREVTGWASACPPVRGLQEGAGKTGNGALCFEIPGCVNPLPGSCVKSGDFRRQRSVGAGFPCPLPGGHGHPPGNG